MDFTPNQMAKNTSPKSKKEEKRRKKKSRKEEEEEESDYDIKIKGLFFFLN